MPLACPRSLFARHPILSLCCCSLVSPTRRSCRGAWVQRGVVVLRRNHQLVLNLGKVKLKVVSHELLPSILVVKEYVLAYVLQRLVSLKTISYTRTFTYSIGADLATGLSTLFLEPRLELLDKLPVFLFQLYRGKILLIRALLIVECEK